MIVLKAGALATAAVLVGLAGETCCDTAGLVTFPADEPLSAYADVESTNTPRRTDKVANKINFLIIYNSRFEFCQNARYPEVKYRFVNVIVK